MKNRPLISIEDKKALFCGQELDRKIQLSFDEAKLKCVQEIYSVLFEAIQVKLKDAKENAINDYIKKNLHFWQNEEEVRNQLMKRLNVYPYPGTAYGGDMKFSNIFYFLENDHKDMDLNSLKYLFIHHFFNITAVTDSEAKEMLAEQIIKLSDYNDSFPLPNLKFIPFLLSHDNNLETSVCKNINNLYPGFKLGDKLIELLKSYSKGFNIYSHYSLNHRLEIDTGNNGSELFSSLPIGAANISKTEILLFYVLFDNPFTVKAVNNDANNKKELSKVFNLLSSAIKNGVDAHALAYHMMASITNNNKNNCTDKEAALLVAECHDLINTILYPDYKRDMLFVHAAKNKLPQDVLNEIKQKMIDVEVSKKTPKK